MELDRDRLGTAVKEDVPAMGMPFDALVVGDGQLRHALTLSRSSQDASSDAPLATGSASLAGVYRSVLPVALSLGLTTQEQSERWFDELARDAVEHADHHVLWPLLIGCWKRKR